MSHRHRHPLRHFAAPLLGAAVIVAVASPLFAAEPPSRLVTNATGAYLAARIASNLRDVGSAAAFYGMVLRGDPTNAGLTERTFLLSLSSGDMRTAIELAERLIHFDEANEMSRLTLAADAVKEHRFASAREHLAKIDGGPLSALTTGLLSAWASVGDRDYDAALKTIADLNGPEWYQVFKDYHSGLIAELAGRDQEALDFLRRAYAADQSLRPVEALARMLARSGDRPGAEKVLEDLLAAAPGQPTAAALLADLRAGTMPDGGIASAAGGFAEVLYGIATALTGQGGAEVSAIYLQVALYADPDNPLATIALGQLLQSLQRDEDALALFNRLPESSPLYPTATINAAASLSTLERYDEATAKLAPMVAADPTNMAAVITLGNIYRGQKQFAEASEVYARGIETIAAPTRSDWTIYYYRGITYERTNRWELAEADFKQALELYPDQPQVLNYLGYSWIDKGMNYQEALEMIQRAVDQRPDDGYIVDSLGWAYYKLGQFEEAVKHLERAVELVPSDPVLNDHLGDAYWRIGRKLEAVFQWTHAKELNPEPEDLVRIVRKLESGVLADEPDKDG